MPEGFHQVGQFPHWNSWSEWNRQVSKLFLMSNYYSIEIFKHITLLFHDNLKVEHGPVNTSTTKDSEKIKTLT